MTIRDDDSKCFLIGDDAQDLIEFIRRITADGYPATDIRQIVCSCGHSTFRIVVDSDDNTLALRVCNKCGQQRFFEDSEEFWTSDECDPEDLSCASCGVNNWEIAAGLSFRESGDVTWVTIGHRCSVCRLLASSIDWKVNTETDDTYFESI